MPSRDDAIRLLEASGEHEAAAHVRTWQNARGTSSGWDANLRGAYPQAARLLWHDGHGGVPVGTAAARLAATIASAKSVRHARERGFAAVELPPGVIPAFDAYIAIDWSASSIPKTGADSIWWALALWNGSTAHIESGNCWTRADLVSWVRSELAGPLRDRRTLIGFDFPLGYPRGFATALGHDGLASDAWRFTWTHLAATVQDSDGNANNRFEAAAALNAAVCGGFGPFYGRPGRASADTLRSLSTTQRDHFEFPLRTKCGQLLARRRLADERANTSSSPWFLYGGGNSVGGQALVGIPRVLALRDAFPDALVWPFETGARCPGRDEARIVLAEIYPSLFHERDPASAEVHDKLQVEATVRGFAALDAAGELAVLFAAPPDDPDTLHEEGWVLGVR